MQFLQVRGVIVLLELFYGVLSLYSLKPLCQEFLTFWDTWRRKVDWILL
jgi:hypothetical protein